VRWRELSPYLRVPVAKAVAPALQVCFLANIFEKFCNG
jgi:hypothetical protein